MKILYILPDSSSYGGYGGIETYCRELVEGIAKTGVEIRTLPINPKVLLQGASTFDSMPRAWQLKPYYFWRRFYLQNLTFHNALKRCVSEEVDQWQPDVIHVLHLYLGTCVRQLAVPSIVSCYGLDVDDCPPVRVTFKAANAIHAISTFTLNLALRINAEIAGKCHRLSWGIKQPKTLAPGCNPDFDLICVGRLVRRKNIDTVLQSLVALPHLRFGIVGDGPERQYLENLASSLSLNNVHFLGAVSDDEKWRLLCRSRLFITCPRHEPGDVEGLGLVFFEAQRCGLPVIAAASGGVEDGVGLGGILIDDPESIDQVRNAIAVALDPSRYEQLQFEVRARQKSESWDRFIQAFIDLYSSLISDRSVATTQHGSIQTDGNLI